MERLIRSLPPLGLAIILLLVACSPRTTVTPEPTVAPTVAPTAEPTSGAAEGPTEGEVPTVAPTGDPNEPVTVTSPETPGQCVASPLPELAVRPADETDWVKGASLDEADLIIYEYSDFECPGCGGMYPILNEFLGMNPGVALVYRHFPLDFHQHAQITSEAVEAAGAQGKFWEMHDLLFDRSAEWQPLSTDEIRTQLSTYAEQLDLDVEQFDTALEEGTYAEKVQSQYDEARELGL
ncbi:MAG: thioredoxin domain-containing protein, partial [Anaerolineae bacterium]